MKRFKQIKIGWLHRLMCWWAFLLVTIFSPFYAAQAATLLSTQGQESAYSWYIDSNFIFSIYSPYETEYNATYEVQKSGLVTVPGSFLGRMQKSADDSRAIDLTCLPKYPANGLFVFNDNLSLKGAEGKDGRVIYEVQGDKPNRRMIIRWQNMSFEDTDEPMGTFEAIMYEATGVVKFQYPELAEGRARGEQAVIGINGNYFSSDWPFNEIGCGQANAIRPGQAITFTPMKTDVPWTYEVDQNATFEAIDLYVLTPYGKAVTNQAPEWSWDSVPSVNAYEIEILVPDGWDDETGQPIYKSVFTQNLGNQTTFAYEAGRVHGKDFTARVRTSSDGGTSWGQWSDYGQQIRVDLQAPVFERLTFTRSSVTSGAVSGAFSDDINIRSYDVQIARDAAFTDIVHEELLENVYNLYLFVQDLAQAPILYARARATDYAGNTSEYSAAVVVVNQLVAQQAKSYTNQDPEWAWDDYAGYFNKFEIEVYTGSTYQPQLIARETLGSVTQYAYTGTLTHSAYYFARIRGSTDGGLNWGEWSQYSSLVRVDTVVPSITAVNIYHTQRNAVGVTFRASDTLSGIEKVIIELASDEAFTDIVKTHEVISSYVTYAYISDLPENTRLFARLQSVDRAGNKSVYSSIISTPDAPLATPAARYTNAAPRWSWNKQPQYNTYEVQVLQDALYSEVVGDVGEFTFEEGKVHNTTYKLQVRGSIDGGTTWGAWSSTIGDITTTTVDLLDPVVTIREFRKTSASEAQLTLDISGTGTGYNYEDIEAQFFRDEALTQLVTEIEYNPSWGIIKNLPDVTELYACVRVKDLAGNLSEYVNMRMSTAPARININLSYTNSALEWLWFKTPGYFNAYEIQIEDDAQNVVHTEMLGNVEKFSYSQNLVSGTSYTAKLRGSRDGGQTWSDWSEKSQTMLFDNEAPVAYATDISHTTDGFKVTFIANDPGGSGIGYLNLQVATDPAFSNLVFDGAISTSSSTYSDYIDPQSRDARFYARVQARDYADNVSEYSAAAVSPDAPVITTGAYSGSELVWQWQQNSGYVFIRIEVTNAEGEVLETKDVSYGNLYTYSKPVAHGEVYKARVRGRLNGAYTGWEVWSDWKTTTIDLQAPQISIESFERQVPAGAVIAYTALDDLSGVKSVGVQVARDADFTDVVFEQNMTATSSRLVINDALGEGNLFARIRAYDAVGNVSVYTPAAVIAAAVPKLHQPVTGAVLRQSPITVSGQSVPGGVMHFYLNSQLVATTATADASGNFTTTLALQNEGQFTLGTDVQSASGTSAQSTPVVFTYELPLPNVTFVKPAQGVEIAAPIAVEVSAQDELGIAAVEFYVDGTLQTTLTQAPYVFDWGVTHENNGNRTLMVKVTNTSGKELTLIREVMVNVLPPVLPAPPTPYTGKVVSISPEMTYGEDPVTIKGQAVDRNSGELMANMPLKLVLIVNGFERRIAVVTDSTGNFEYRFVPQASDSGVYQVGLIHTDEREVSAQGSFKVNHLRFNYGGYTLKAARLFVSEIPVGVYSSTGVEGLRWVMLAQNQPSGSLPQGITLDGGSGIDIGVGKSGTLMARFLADDTATRSGVLVLTALASDSGDKARGQLTVQYQLEEAQPGLYAQTSRIVTGVSQGDSVMETATFTNRGLVAAKEVHVKLLDEDDNAAPEWIFIASPKALGTVNVGDQISVEVVAQPTDSVAEGIYRFKLGMSATNDTGGYIPVTVSVTQSGIGSVRFDVADIYTATLSENGQPIKGVNGVAIKLQNEAVLSEEYKVNTDQDGLALLEDIPAGIYLFRASASNHMDVSGRVRVRPGVTTEQHIFLDYQLINIEFGLTETTIEDVYDIVLEATYQTQVPAPVVLLEPMSINLGGMQVGEEKTGQLTLTNYGLIEAQALKLDLPQSDSQFNYEFFADIPDSLPPKTRIVIPYRVTAIGQGGQRKVEVAQVATSDNSEAHPLGKMLSQNARATQCYSYIANYGAGYEYECINGEWRKGRSTGNFHSTTGTYCTGSSINWGAGGGWGGGLGGGWGSGWGSGWGGSSSIYLGPQCTPDCDECCFSDGKNNAQ